MDMDDAINQAREGTRIVRARKNLLFTFGATRLPYVCLSVDPAQSGRVRLRYGEVTAQRPSIALLELPGMGSGSQGYAFEGFHPESFTEPSGRTESRPDSGGGEADGQAARMLPFLIARQVSIPPATYVNKAENLAVEQGTMDDAVGRALTRLDNAHDIRTGLLVAPEAVWNLGVLLYVGSQMARSASSNVAEHLERLRLNQP